MAGRCKAADVVAGGRCCYCHNCSCGVAGINSAAASSPILTTLPHPEQISLRANPTTPRAVFVSSPLSKFYLVLYGCRVLLPCVLRGWTVGTGHTGTRPGHSSSGPGRWCSDNSSLAHPDNRNSHLLYIYYFYLTMQYVWVSSEVKFPVLIQSTKNLNLAQISGQRQLLCHEIWIINSY